MELKAFNEYTKEEIKDLLSHWFNYYGKKAYTLDELDKFMKMVDAEPTHCFEVAAMLFKKGLGSTLVLEAIRGDKSQLENMINEYNTFSHVTKMFLHRDFVEEVVKTYNDPEPAIPKKDKELRQEIKDLTGKNYDYLPQIDWTKLDDSSKSEIRSIIDSLKKAKTDEEQRELSRQFFRILQKSSNVTIDPEKVKKVFVSCMFADSDIKDERPTKQCSIVKGINNGIYYLDTEKINQHIMEIKELIDLLPDLRKPQSVDMLFMDRAGRIWTEDSQLVEILMVLGMAAERIEYAYPQEELKAQNDGIPVIVELDNRTPGIISGYEPCEIDEAIEALTGKKVSEEKEETSSEDISEFLEIFKTQYPHIEPVMHMSGYSIKQEGNDFYLCHADGEKINKMRTDLALGRYSLVARDGEYSIMYSYTIDGRGAYGGIIDRNILSINGLKKLADDTYDGRQIRIELGNGLVNVTHDPRIEITITEPSGEDIITHYELDEFGLSIAIENDEGEFGNKENGTKRIVKYTNVLKTPSNKVSPIFIGEKILNGDAHYISIDGFVEDAFRHALSKFKTDGSGHVHVFDAKLKPNEEVMNIANEYLKTSRIKNLYNHISNHIENIIPGMQEFIRANYPLSNNIEGIMKESASIEFEDRLNSNMLKEANLKEEKDGIKKELKPEDN